MNGNKPYNYYTMPGKKRTTKRKGFKEPATLIGWAEWRPGDKLMHGSLFVNEQRPSIRWTLNRGVRVMLERDYQRLLKAAHKPTTRGKRR